MSKKLISVLLAVVMVITAAFGGMTVSAEGVTNYVGDGGFENADFSGTILNFGTGGATQTQTWGRFSSGVTRMELVTSANYSSEDSVELNGNQYLKSGVTADGNYIRGFGQILELTAGDYVLSFIAKSDAGNLFSAGIYNTSVNSISVSNAIAYTYLDATNYWKEYTLEFTVSADGIYHLIIGGNSGGDSNIRLFYMDNVAVYAKNSVITIDAVATVGGTVTGGGVVSNGDTVTLTATAKSGYTFEGWSDGDLNATRSFTATANATYTANFTKNSADFVPNGDFESEDWVLSDYWTSVSGHNVFLEAADPENANNTVAYAEGAKGTSMVSKNTITLKQGHTYVLKFNSYIAAAVEGNGTNFYRVGFLIPGATALGGANFVSGAFYSVYNNTTSSERGTWKEFTYEYTHNSADTEANIVLGMYNNECTSDWYIDNIASYDKADVCEMTVTAQRGGSVTGTKTVYVTGEVLTLTAVAKEGFEFAGWSDGEASATRTVTATAGAAYVAQFTRTSANLAVNGDFEDDSWSIADAWGVVVNGDKHFEKAVDANGNTYAKTVPSTRRSLASDVITVQPGESIVLEFDSRIVYKTGETNTGDNNGFYRYGFIEASQTNLGGSAFTSLAGNSYQSYTPGVATEVNQMFYWNLAKKTYTNTGDTAVEVKAVIGYYDNSCTFEWQIDNVKIYNTKDVVTVSVSAENGTATAATALKGESVTVTATPEKEGYEFLGWYNGDAVVSTSEAYTFVADENVTLVAKYKIVYPPVYSVVNGDFENSDNLKLTTNLTGSDEEGVWGKVGTGVNMFALATATDEDPDFVGSAYALATVPSEGYVRTFGQFVTLKPNTDYTLEFLAKNNIVSGNAVPVYGAVIKRMTGSHGVTVAGGAANVVSPASYAIIENNGEWQRYKVEFNSGNVTEAVVAFGSNTTATAGMYFAVDNVVLTECKTVYISDFENGADGWTATNGATVTTTNIASTAIAGFAKYLGNNVGILNPVAEGDVFTSPAFATKVGERYDVVIYTRHNSADATRGNFSFTAGGEKENLSIALYGRPGDDSELGKYENNDGFMVNPISMGATAKYDSDTFTKLIFTFTATAETHNISITANTPVSAFIDGFVLYAHSDAVELAENSVGFKGTAIRTTGVQGLRFKNTISVDALTHLGNYARVVEYGTLAIKEDYKVGALTVENLTDGTYEYTKTGGTVGCRLKVGVAYKAEDGTDVAFAKDLYNIDFTGVLVGISEDNYSSNYVTRAYAKVQFADGSYAYVYGDEQVASVSAVAQYIVDNNLETAEIRDYLNTNILGK